MSTQQTEVRFLKATELRAGGGTDGVAPFISGYAAVFNKYSSDLGGFKEKIKPGAFSRALRERQDVRCLFNHDANCVLGRLLAGTLTVSEDPKGLLYRCELPDTTTARDLHVSISRGDISQCSFSFSVRDGGDIWSTEYCDPDDSDEDCFASRTLTDVNLFDVSPVTFPAYQNTSVSARSGVWADIVPLAIRSVIETQRANRTSTHAEDEDRKRRLRLAQMSL